VRGCGGSAAGHERRNAREERHLYAHTCTIGRNPLT
jgi:hypothetical protein